MRNFIALFLFFVTSIFSQTSEKNVWDLLLSNKRQEARVLFDKELKSKEDSNVDYLILDAILEHELGKLDFDDQFLQKFIKVCKKKEYLYPLFYEPYIFNSSNYNDYTYKEIDELAASNLFSNDPMVVYFKAICDRNRKIFDGYVTQINKLGAIQDWQYCGMFENLNGSGLDTEYEPEYYANNNKLFEANSNGKVSWFIPADKQNEGYHFFDNEKEYGEGIIYSQVFINSPEDKDVILKLGTSSTIKIFVNDIEIYVNDTSDFSNLNAYLIKFNLKKGINRLLVKFSTKANNNFFYTAITDTLDKEIPNLTYYNSYQPYNKSTIEELDVTELSPKYEEFFKELIANNPENVLYKILLYNAYSNNGKVDKAYEILEELIHKYSKSSLVQVMLANYHYGKNDNQKAIEIEKNIELSDENYYYNIVNKVYDNDWFTNTNIIEIEKYSEKIKTVKSNEVNFLYEYNLALRKSDVNTQIQKLEELFSNSNNNETFLTDHIEEYEQLINDKAKIITMLENLVSTKENITALNLLSGYYDETDRKEDKEKIVHDLTIRYPYFNNYKVSYIDLLIENKKYDQALFETDKALANFPYSFLLLQQKGTIYNELNNNKEAEKYFRLALLHNPENSELRKQLYDITKTPDEIEEVSTKDIYQVIKARRDTQIKGDFGVTKLLDEYIVNVFPEGGRKSKVTCLFEITSEKGIEQMKEFNLGYGIVTSKSEIVKKDGTVVPAENGDGTLVFTNLLVGDVIYIQYEQFENSSGRFFKDLNLAYNFNYNYPCLESIFGFIYPPGFEYLIDFNNVKIPAISKKINNKECMIWKQNNTPPLPLKEDYAPIYSDRTNKITISSIKNWKEISNWYSDLAKKSLKLDKITKDTFNSIFPNGVVGISENEIAKKIYAYIEDNIKYSSLDFRQSGHIPQKPSKTISTKLGDCKDVSTLFVAFSQLAGLKANLVLVLTNDNGISSLRLPSQGFNHCIAKVFIDSKEYFIELTNNHLPFKALPKSLYHANALVISFDKEENEKSKIINIPFDNANKNSIYSNTIVTIEDKSKSFISTNTCQGTEKSYFNELFSDATTEEYRKKIFEEDYNSLLNRVVSLQYSKLISKGNYDNEITFETQFSVQDRNKSVGNLKIANIPFLEQVYTRNLIALVNRNYDINYYNFEINQEYNSEIILNISNDKKFIEIPENKNFIFKGHSFQITYDLISPSSLKVVRKVSLNRDIILKEDYLNFKNYVEDVIEAEEQMVGYK